MVTITHFSSFTRTVGMHNFTWNDAKRKTKTVEHHSSWSYDSIWLSGRSTFDCCLLLYLWDTHPLKMSSLFSSSWESNDCQHYPLSSQNFQCAGSFWPSKTAESFQVIFPSHCLDTLGLEFQGSLRPADLKAWSFFSYKSYLYPDRPPCYLDQKWYILGPYNKNKDYQCKSSAKAMCINSCVCSPFDKARFSLESFKRITAAL